MFANIIEISRHVTALDAEMKQKHPREEVLDFYSVAGFSFPCLRITEGFASSSWGGEIKTGVSTKYYILFSSIGSILEMRQTRFDHALRKLNKKSKSSIKMRSRSQIWRNKSLYIEIDVFKDLIKHIAIQRPYVSALDALYCDMFPNTNFMKRRKNSAS